MKRAITDKDLNSVRPKRYNMKMRLLQESPIKEAEKETGSSENFENGMNSCATTITTSSELENDTLTIENTNYQPIEEILVNNPTVEPNVGAHVYDFDDLIANIGHEQLNDVECENIEEYLDINTLVDDIEIEYEHEPDEDNEHESYFNFSDDNEDSFDVIQTIFHGHHMPVWVSMVMILLHMITNCVSKRELEQILILISAHCLETHPGLRSLFHFKKHFASFSSPLKKHFYCSNCLACVDQNSILCSNRYCMKQFTGPKTKSYFIELSIKEQLKVLFNRSYFTDLIQERFKRKIKNNEIQDIYDGEIYQYFSRDGGPLSKDFPNNISFVLNTDGVAIFKSSKFSLWPVYLMINELPYKNRKLIENMILAGLWFGDTKPLMSTFLKPIYQSLRELEEKGMDITIGENNIHIKAHLLCIAADLPAKSLLMNMNQFNGEYSCGKCLHKGETFKTNKGGCVHIFPYKMNDTIQERTKSSCIDDAVNAKLTKTTVNGIKGPSFLMGLHSFNFTDGASIDYMHGVLLGVAKLLIKLWLSSPFSKEDFSLMEYADLIDQRLMAIKPPRFITRVPRSIISHFKYWKASEVRSWLFFYSLPILNDLMEDSYLLHFACLVEAINYLCGDNITLESINKSEQLIKYFVLMFSKLYGERYLTLNVHQLIHLPCCVRKLGPLWAYSCFTFENANGELTKLFHGTQNIELQVLSSVNIIHNLPALLESLPDRYKETFQKLYPGRMRKTVHSFHIQFLGRNYRKELPHYIMEELLLLLDMEPPNMEYHNRVILRGQILHSKDYERAIKRNSYTVKYFCRHMKCMRYGFIQYFGIHKRKSLSSNMNDECITQSFAFITAMDNLGSITRNISISNTLQVTVPHIQPCKASSKIRVVKLENIMGICAYVSFGNDMNGYVCEPANTFEVD